MKCQTIQCPRSAQTRVDFQYPDGDQFSQHVCGPCARYYVMYSGTSALDDATATWTLEPPD